MKHLKKSIAAFVFPFLLLSSAKDSTAQNTSEKEHYTSEQEYYTKIFSEIYFSKFERNSSIFDLTGNSYLLKTDSIRGTIEGIGEFGESTDSEFLYKITYTDDIVSFEILETLSDSVKIYIGGSEIDPKISPYAGMLKYAYVKASFH